jgi:hypothetical protein
MAVSAQIREKLDVTVPCRSSQKRPTGNCDAVREESRRADQRSSGSVYQDVEFMRRISIR